MNNPVQTRLSARRILATNPERDFTEHKMFLALGRLTTDALTVEELKTALLWNTSEGFASKRLDTDLGEEVWTITPKGRKAEGFR